MKRDDDGLPRVGANSNELGVRVAPHNNPDIDDDGNGNAKLNDGGMSVSENWRFMLAHLIPKRLRIMHAAAAGNNSLTCYRHGNGPFVPASVGGHPDLSLILKPHNPRAGLITPAQQVSIPQFQNDLAATRAEWVVDET